MKKFFILILGFSMTLNMMAQLEVKEGSFKEVEGFVNINPDPNYQFDDNDKPFAVLKVNTENINDKQRRELKFEGNAATFIMLEYKTGEVWVYLTAKYADYIKVSHPDFGSIEFTLPCDLKPKCGYEITLTNKHSIDEDILNRLERLEKESVKVQESSSNMYSAPQQITNNGTTSLFNSNVIRWFITSQPKGADVYWRVVSSTPDVKNTNRNYLGTTPYESTETLDIKGLKMNNAGNVQIEVTCEKAGYLEQTRRFNLEQIIDQKEVSTKFNLIKED